MPFDGAGNFTRDFDFEQDRNNGIKILASRIDGEFDNYSNALNQVFLRDGTASMSANMKLGGYKITQLADGTAGAPSIIFNSDPDTGIYWHGSGEIGFASNGTLRFYSDATGISVSGNVRTTTGATFGGAVVITTGNLSLTTGNVSAVNVTASAALTGASATVGTGHIRAGSLDLFFDTSVSQITFGDQVTNFCSMNYSNLAGQLDILSDAIRLGRGSGSSSHMFMDLTSITFVRASTFNSTVSVKGNATLGDAAGDAHTINGTLTFANVPASYANDAAAQAGGIGVGGLYRNGSVLMIRVA